MNLAKDHTVFSAKEFGRKASPSYLTEFTKYTKKYGCNHSLTCVKEAARDFAKSMEGEEGRISEIQAYVTHWQLRDNQAREFTDNLSTLAPATLCTHWGMQEFQ